MLAASRFVGLVDAKSEHVAAHVSERLLEQSGDLKPRNAGNSVNVSINNNIAPGYVIDLSGAATVDVTPSDKRSLANDDQPIDK